MKETFLELALLSEATPGRGEGTAGEVDVEIEHDRNGLPLFSGKTVHGLLLEAWLMMAPYFPELPEAGLRVFGKPGANQETAILRIGDAQLPEAVRSIVHWALNRPSHPLTADMILRALTDIRRQTAQSRERSAPENTTLRATRVLLPGLVFRAPLTWLKEPTPEDERCLALATLAMRQLGHGRNRGRGYISLAIAGDEKATRHLAGLEVLTT